MSPMLVTRCEIIRFSFLTEWILLFIHSLEFQYIDNNITINIQGKGTYEILIHTLIPRREKKRTRKRRNNKKYSVTFCQISFTH